MKATAALLFDRHYLIAIWLISICIGGCRSPQPSSDNSTFLQATTSLRRGDFQTAQRLAEAGLAQWQGQSQSEWYWKYRILLADAYINLGKSKEAADLLETHPPNRADFGEMACRSRTVRAKALWRLGRTEEAGRLLDEAEALATSGGWEALTPEIFLLRAILLDTLDKPDEAEEALQLSLQRSRELNDTYWETIGLNNLGYRRLRHFRYDEAIPILTRAEEGFRAIGAPLLASIAQANIALCANRLGDFDRALAEYRTAIEVQEREGAKTYLVGSLGEMGNIYFFQQQFKEAAPHYERALKIALEIGAISDASKWAGNLASVMIELEDWTAAEQFNEQSRQLKLRINDVDSQTYTRLNAAQIAVGRGDSQVESLHRELIRDTADKPAILWEAHASMGKLYRNLGNNAKASEHYETAIRIIETGQAELSLPDYRITFFARLIKFYQEYVDALVEQGQSDRALEIVESSRSRVLLERFGRAASTRTAVGTLSDVRRWQQSGTVVLSYWLGPSRSFLWAVTPAKRELFVLPGRREIEMLVQTYNGFVHDLRDPLVDGHAAGERLYEILVSPVRNMIPQAARVVVVPDGALHNLNFEILPVPGPTPHYWIEDVVLSVAPSLAVRPDAGTKPQLKSVLLIGDPESASEEYQKLPNADDEIRNIERRLGSLQQAVYEGAFAEPSAYRAAQPDRFSIIHFAAHATANRENPMESAIILSPVENSFKLYAREVAELPLRADLVTISACRSAGARVYSGEGLVGFTWAFLQAGARHVIAGLWDVTDQSTAQLMDRLYQGLNEGASAPRALRDAKLALIHSTSNFRKPYYWGPFQIYLGNGG